MNKNKMHSGTKLVINGRLIASCVLGIFMVFYLFVTLQTVSSGAKLASLEKNENDLNKENRELTLQLVEASSLTKLGEKAGDLGFAKPQETKYLTQEDSVAKLP